MRMDWTVRAVGFARKAGDMAILTVALHPANTWPRDDCLGWKGAALGTKSFLLHAYSTT